MTKLDTFGALKDHVNSTVEIYSYDGLNRLQEVRKGGTTVSYVYNAEGIRTSKTVNGITTEFLLDGANVVAETKNNTTTNYIRGITGIISSSIQGTNNTTKYYTSDGHGNITKLTDSTGTIVKTYVYDAFGVEQNIDSNDTNPFRYCGEYYDNEIGKIYLRARYYDPSLGRFTQSDPAMADGMNWYSYCGSDPLNKIDPMGLEEVILRYIVEKNGGSVEWNSDRGTATVYMPGYAPLEVSGKNINGRIIVDSQYLVDNFKISEYGSKHQSGDWFGSEEDAVMAFGLKYHSRAQNEQQEYGAIIDSYDGKSFTFRCVENSTSSWGSALFDAERREDYSTVNRLKNSVKIHWEEHHVAVVHIHWENANNSFSNIDRDAKIGNGHATRYLIKHDGTVQRIYPSIYSEDGYSKSENLYQI